MLPRVTEDNSEVKLIWQELHGKERNKFTPVPHQWEELFVGHLNRADVLRGAMIEVEKKYKGKKGDKRRKKKK